MSAVRTRCIDISSNLAARVCVAYKATQEMRTAIWNELDAEFLEKDRCHRRNWKGFEAVDFAKLSFVERARV